MPLLLTWDFHDRGPAMRQTTWTAAGTFCFATLGLAAAAHACGGHFPPDRYSTLPGATLLRPDMLAVLPILSGTLERPFYSLAGHRTHTWAFAIQANLLAYLVAAISGCFSLAMMSGWETLPLLLIPVAVGLLVKWWWFARVPCEATARSTNGRVGLFAFASAFSATMIGLIPLWMTLLGTDTFNWAWKTRDLRAVMILLTLALCSVTLISLFMTYRRPAKPTDEARRGFDVLPANSELPVARPVLDV